MDKYQLGEEDEIWDKAGRAVIPPDDALQREVLKNAHDHPAVGCPSIKKTLLAIARNY
jgi:hypothetical protein